jgi:hypothetical protein
VEHRIGQPICRFPNGTGGSQVSPAEPTTQWATLEPVLRDAFCCHHARATGLLGRRNAIAQQLLESGRELEELLNGYGEASHWVDRTHLQRRQKSLRSRISGWFADAGIRTSRHEAAERLIHLGRTSSEFVNEHYQRLQRQRQTLQQQLSSMDATPLLQLTASNDPRWVAESRLKEAAIQGRERWLRDQLSREPLRSWQIEGFGEARLRMLESHGLCRGDQLHAHIDRLQALPGIGAGLQQRLRTHLDRVIHQLEAQAPHHKIGPNREDLIPLQELLALQNGEQQLQALNREQQSFAVAVTALRTMIAERRAEATTLTVAFESLC